MHLLRGIWIDYRAVDRVDIGGAHTEFITVGLSNDFSTCFSKLLNSRGIVASSPVCVERLASVGSQKLECPCRCEPRSILLEHVVFMSAVQIFILTVVLHPESGPGRACVSLCPSLHSTMAFQGSLVLPFVAAATSAAALKGLANLGLPDEEGVHRLQTCLTVASRRNGQAFDIVSICRKLREPMQPLNGCLSPPVALPK